MSLAQILEELPAFTVAERQLLVRRAIGLDEPAFSEDDERLIESRLADHLRDPVSSVSLDVMKASLHAEFGK